MEIKFYCIKSETSNDMFVTTEFMEHKENK